MQRRHFLQLTTTTALLTATGAIATPRPPKKLALLIGINTYPHPDIPNLKGCLNDTELQRTLLIDRLNFQPQDILTLTDQQATRSAIIRAFETHLIQQAQPNDIVLIHFSGHGSRIQDPDPLTADGFNGALVPYDYGDPQGPSVNAIMGKTIHLLLTALPTPYVTTIFDCCHAEGSLRKPNGLTRSIDHLRRGDSYPTTSDADRADQERWLKTLNWNTQDLQASRQKGHAKGIGLGSAGRNQLANDASFDDFNAGAFTYLLTRALWQASPTTTLRQIFDQIAHNTHTLAHHNRIFQTPIYTLAPGQEALADRPPYLTQSDRPAAEGTLRLSKGTELEFWLGGIDPQALPAFKQGAQFILINDRGLPLGTVKQTRRSGLIGYGQITTGQIPPTQRPLLREAVRGIPTDFQLRLGLTPNLQSATATLTQAPLRHLQLATDNIDLWLTKTPDRTLGLLHPDNRPIPSSFGPPDESPAQAIVRLRPQIQSLLATRLLHTIPHNSLQGLQLKAEVYEKTYKQPSPLRFPAGKEITIQLTNPNSQPLHIVVVSIDSDGYLTVLAPLDWNSAAAPPPISPGDRLTLPQPNDRYRFVLQPPAGFLEILVLGSTQPLQDTLKSLHQLARTSGVRSGTPLNLKSDQLLTVTTDLLRSVNRSFTQLEKPTTYDIDNRQLTSLSITIEVMEPM